MFKKIYWNYRKQRIGSFNLWEQSLNWEYDLQFFNSGMFEDFKNANIVKLTQPISEDKYNWVIPLINNQEQVIWTIPKLTRFCVLEYSDIYTTEEYLKASIEKSWAINNVTTFTTIEEAKQWVRDNTTLTETETPWTFIISDETTNPLTWEIIPQELLVIN